MNKILLCLVGKRIEFAKVVEAVEESFDWVEAVYPASPDRSFILIENEATQYELAISKSSYYDSKAKKVKAMTKVDSSVDKTTMENDGVDSVTYKITATEPMDIIIHQASGSLRENGIFSMTPVKGIITVKVNSDMLGTVRLAAIGDTTYTDNLEVSVV